MKLFTHSRSLFFFVLGAIATLIPAFATDSLTITYPTSGATVTGTINAITSTAVGADIVKVCYTLDGTYPLYTPGIDAPSTLGCSITAPFTYPSYNSFWNGNSTQHTMNAVAYDAKGNTVATATPVTFTIGNTWPLSYVAQIALTNSCSTTWASNTCSVQWTWSGTGAANSKTVNLYVDDIIQGSFNATTSGTNTFDVDTLPYQNGNHYVCVIGTDNVAGTTVTGTDGQYTGAATEQCILANFQNGTTASQIISNASAIYLSVGGPSGGNCNTAPIGSGSCTLTAAVLNTDGTTSATTGVFSSDNTAVASVGASTGLLTAAGNGSTQINVGSSSACSGTDLAGYSTYLNRVYSTTNDCLFGPNSAGGVVVITSNTGGWIAGTYTIEQVLGVAAVLSANAVSTTGVTGGYFSTGPGGSKWVYVWPSNTLPHFSNTGAVLTSYNPATSFVPHCMFQSSFMFTFEQPYSPGMLSDFNSSAINCFEVGIIPDPLSNFSTGYTQASYASYISSSITRYAGYISSYPNLYLGFAGDNLVDTGPSLYFATNGTGGCTGSGCWSTSAFATAIAQWQAAAPGHILSVAMIDENAPAFTYQPLAGPISYSSSPGQSWLQSMTCTGSTCTVTTNGGWSIQNGNGTFVIHNSAVTGMNSVAPAVYTASVPQADNAGTFTFASTAAAGSYNATGGGGFTADPNLVLEPLGGWYTTNPTAAYDYLHYDAFAKVYSQATAAGITISYPAKGADNGIILNGTRNMAGNWNCTGSQFLGSVTCPSHYANIYYSGGVATTGGDSYMISREGLNALLTYNGGNPGLTIKSGYGTLYSPSVPLVSITESTQNYFGLQGYPVSVASCSGSLITFSAPHGLTNIIPGMTRLYLSGATDNGTVIDSCNGNFLVLSAPTATSLAVTLAATDFAEGSTLATGGTATFQDGSTMAIQTSLANCNATYGCISASNGTPVARGGYTNGTSGQGGYLTGDILYPLAQSGTCMQTTTDPGCSKKRGQTFTLSGVSGSAASYFNSKTFLLAPWNLNFLTANGGQFPTGQYVTLVFTQVPSLSATGGTASIVPNNNFQKGVGASINLQDTNALFSFGYCMVTVINRGAGDRWYQVRPFYSGYSDQFGFMSPYSAVENTLYGGTAFAGVGDQLSMNEHFENSATKPIYEAANNCDRMQSAYKQFLLQPTCNAPDVGLPQVDATCRTGSYGKALLFWNGSDGPAPITVPLTAYETSGQNILEVTGDDHSLVPRSISAGAASDSFTLGPGQAALYILPTVFAGTIQQPSISPRLADVTNATQIVVLWSTSRYFLDVAGNVFNCGSANPCTPLWDRNLGTIYYRLRYLNSSNQVLATSDVQTL